ncbi:hypothetical protein [Algibacter sp.]|uniref:hypothetical protein n=1 Tax=Algibacter sp. TaxID=1872428 RepID=UPI003C724163
MNNYLKYTLYVLPLVLFVSMILHDVFFNKKKELLIDDFIDIEVVRARKYKNIIILKDTIAIFQKTKRVFPKKSKHFYKNYYQFIESVETPYHLFKDSGSNIMVIIKNKDSLFYKLHPL